VIQWHKRGNIQYIPFPDHLVNAYQHFTEADISLLRKAGYKASFASVEQGVFQYLDWLKAHE
jgi:ADP-L-glycero-D-manno-heptose 6-epimerase